MQDSGTIELLSYMSLLVLVIVFIIIGLIRELAPEQKSKWFLSLALGAGVTAFSLKIIFIISFSLFSIPFLDKLPEPKIRAPYSASIEEDQKIFQPQSIRLGNIDWQPLPVSAPIPEDNPQTPEKIALGRTLFFDQRLSLDNSLSCASCHELSDKKGGTDGRATSEGIHLQLGDRNAPTVFNAAFQKLLFWDGRARSLEEQALGPLINPIEMGMPDLASVETKLKNIGDYPSLFATAFPDSPNITSENIAKAIAAFERTLITPDSPYDRFVQGDRSALSQKQLRGMALFESLGCTNCHSGPNFSDASVFGSTEGYRIFPANPNPYYEEKYQFSADQGVAGITTSQGSGLWRIPSLRNVARTAPYFHNGSVDSLEEAVRIMATLQLGKVISENETDDKHVFWSGADRGFNISDNRALTNNQVSEIVAFLHALNGALPEI